jgi:anti-sigma B factor antagonist
MGVDETAGVGASSENRVQRISRETVGLMRKVAGRGATRPRPEPPCLGIEAGEEGDTYIVQLHGELDLDGCESVEAALMQAESSRAHKILLDLDRLSFIDSSGLRLLVSAASRDTGDRLRITRGSRQVAEIFRLTTLDRLLPLV